MPIVTPAQARAQARVDADYPVEQLQPAIDGAVEFAQGYLNRAVYADAESLTSARSNYPAEVAAAAQALQDARDAADAIADEAERCAARLMADVEYREAMAQADRCVHGIVVNSAIRSAILLVFGHLFANRAAVVTGTISAEVHLGAVALLRPYRRTMMP